MPQFVEPATLTNANTPYQVLALAVAAGYLGTGAAQKLKIKSLDTNGAAIVAIGNSGMATVADGDPLLPGESDLDQPGSAPGEFVDLTQTYLITDIPLSVVTLTIRYR